MDTNEKLVKALEGIKFNLALIFAALCGLAGTYMLMGTEVKS